MFYVAQHIRKKEVVATYFKQNSLAPPFCNKMLDCYFNQGPPITNLYLGLLQTTPSIHSNEAFTASFGTINEVVSYDQVNRPEWIPTPARLVTNLNGPFISQDLWSIVNDATCNFSFNSIDSTAQPVFVNGFFLSELNTKATDGVVSLADGNMTYIHVNTPYTAFNPVSYEWRQTLNLGPFYTFDELKVFYSFSLRVTDLPFPNRERLIA